MRSPLIAAVLAVTTTVAFAQPGQTPPPSPSPYPPAPAPPAPQPYPQPYPPAPPPQPQPYVPPPYAYQPPPPQVQLTAEEAKLLQRGEISSDRALGGFAVGFLLGFGSGQAVQGRWAEKGWIFTFGEIAAFAGMIIGAEQMVDNCFEGTCEDDNSGVFVVSILALVTFRVWELVDAAIGPAGHNRKVRELRARVGYPQGMYYGATPYVAPTTRGDGGTAGVTFRF